MDLGTVREELMAGNYRFPKDFQDDVRLIFANSKKYNTNKRSRVSNKQTIYQPNLIFIFKIFAMSQRLSNLFEARMKQLFFEWKSSKRKKKQPPSRRTNMQPNSPQPGPSHRFETFDSLKSSDDEPKPSTSGMSSNRVRALSDSDDDTNLSTLRNNLNNEENLNGEPSPVARFKVQNGVVDDNATTDGETSKELNTLKNGKTNGIEVNGHSYTKPLVNGNGALVAESSDEESEDEYKPVKHEEEGSTSVEEDSKASATDWSEPSGTSSGSEGPSLSKGRRVRVHHVKKSRSTRPNSSDSDDNLPLAASRTVDGSESDEESDSDSDGEPLVRKSKRKNKGRRRNVSSEDSPPRTRKRRRRRGSSDSGSSGWGFSDNENGRTKRVLRTRFKRTANSEDSDDSPTQTVSSRGRVRKMTERAREAMRRKS